LKIEAYLNINPAVLGKVEINTKSSLYAKWENLLNIFHSLFRSESCDWIKFMHKLMQNEINTQLFRARREIIESVGVDRLRNFRERLSLREKKW